MADTVAGLWFATAGLPHLACQQCRVVAFPDIYWGPTKNPKIIHLGAKCPSCSAWIKWLPQTEEWLAEAPTKP